MAIGLGLAPSAISNCSNNWWLAIVALGLVIIFNIFGKGMAKILPILLGLLGAVIVAVVLALTMGQNIIVDGMEYIAVNGKESMIVFSTSKLQALKDAAWVGNPIEWSSTVFGGVKDSGTAISAIIAIVPIALATMMEHIGDISAISATCGKNYIKNPGLHRTLLGDGFATILASLFGAPANTTYGENTGVLALSKVYDPRVIRIAAYFALLFSLSPKFAAAINLMPTAVIGGISFVLYGMISAVGVRNVVEAKVDFSKSRNTIIAAIILVLALGSNGVSFSIGEASISISALATASVVGIILNVIFPGNDYVFEMENKKENAAEAEAKAKTK